MRQICIRFHRETIQRTMSLPQSTTHPKHGARKKPTQTNKICEIFCGNYHQFDKFLNYALRISVFALHINHDHQYCVGVIQSKF